MKSYVIFAWITVFAAASFSNEKGKSANEISDKTRNDFREFKWGANKAEVKKKEKASLLQDLGKILKYEDKVLDRDCLVFYSFLDGKLVSGRYLCDIDAQNYHDLYNSCLVFEFLLYKKYGDAMKSEPKWFSNGYDQTSDSDKGKALALGDYVLKSEYGNPKTRIIYQAKGDNGIVGVSMDYVSKGDLDKIEKDAIESELDKF